MASGILRTPVLPGFPSCSRDQHLILCGPPGRAQWGANTSRNPPQKVVSIRGPLMPDSSQLASIWWNTMLNQWALLCFGELKWLGMEKPWYRCLKGTPEKSEENSVFGLVHAFCAEYVCILSQSRLKPKEKALVLTDMFLLLSKKTHMLSSVLKCYSWCLDELKLATGSQNWKTNSKEIRNLFQISHWVEKAPLMRLLVWFSSPFPHARSGLSSFSRFRGRRLFLTWTYWFQAGESGPSESAWQIFRLV